MASLKDPTRTKADYSSLVPAVEQASRVLLTLAQDATGKMSLTEICKVVGIHKSKGYSILNTLQHFAFVQKSPGSKTYSLGPGLLFLSNKVLNKLDLRKAVAPVLQELSFKTDSTAFLGLISDKHVFVVAKDEGTQHIGLTIRLGHRFPLAWGAHGKAILAFLSDAEREKLIAGSKLYLHGTKSKFDPDRFEQEMANCRRTGFSMDLGEMTSGVNAVAAPVFGPVEKLIGALVILGTFPKESAGRFGSEVSGAAAKFSKQIGGTVPPTLQQNSHAEEED
ncbi:MAG: IclR family transcriptional regulator [Desulfomonile tiedjei]|nr:IclR family transcriptional regulator [Desulfomonile tiedjei]